MLTKIHLPRSQYYKRITTPDDFYIPTTFYTCCESPEQLETLSLYVERPKRNLRIPAFSDERLTLFPPRYSVKLFKRLHGLCWLYDASASAEAVQESFNFWSARIFEYLRGRDKSSLPIYVIGTNKGSARPETVELGKAIAESLDAAHFTLAPKDTSSINRTFLNIFSRCFQDAMKRLAESFDLLVDEHNMKAAL